MYVALVASTVNAAILDSHPLLPRLLTQLSTRHGANYVTWRSGFVAILRRLLKAFSTKGETRAGSQK